MSITSSSNVQELVLSAPLENVGDLPRLEISGSIRSLRNVSQWDTVTVPHVHFMITTDLYS